jgi:hypothetical protein
MLFGLRMPTMILKLWYKCLNIMPEMRNNTYTNVIGDDAQPNSATLEEALQMQRRTASGIQGGRNMDTGQLPGNCLPLK